MSLRDVLGKRQLRVIVELTGASADDEVLRRLQSLGFAVERILGNKLTGSVPANRLRDLEDDPSVRAVETSTKLELS